MRLILALLLSAFAFAAHAQRLLTLDSCRALALGNNKQLASARLKQEAARNLRKAARTKYLPRVSALGAYVYTSEPVSLLSDQQISALSGLGTSVASPLAAQLQGSAASITAQQKAALDNMLAPLNTSTDQILSGAGQQLGELSSRLNAAGQRIVDALDTDTRHTFVGSIMLTQPLFMGGSIVAANKLASLGEQLAANKADATSQQTVLDADNAYWTVVSLKHKQRLAEGYLALVRQLDADVQKMIAEGVATRSDGLAVAVRLNEAEMQLTQVADGLVLSRMLLCQICGLPLDEPIALADEDAESLAPGGDMGALPSTEEAIANRPETRMLQNAVDMGRQTTNILRAGNLPQLALMGGYAVSNPNVLNGFQRKFGGFWNVGVVLRVPILNWGDVAYKVRAAKNATAMAALELDEAKEKMELQVSQSSFKLAEAHKRLAMASSNTARAEENLRCATLGFKEGVMKSSTVMEAQTAWLQAQSQKIDAEISVKLSQASLRKAMGISVY